MSILLLLVTELISRGSNVKETQSRNDFGEESTIITSLGVSSGVSFIAAEYLPHVLGREHSI